MFKIMIVDDEVKIRRGLSQFIDWNSFDCAVIHVASNGDEAIKNLSIEKPDIILTDIRMPKINGIELAKYIYENHPDIKLIILTGYADFEYSKQAIKYNIVDFVLKPTSPPKIITAIEKAKQEIVEKRNLSNKINTLESELKKTTEHMVELTIHKIINQIPIDESSKNMYLNASLFNNNCRFCCLLINIDYKDTNGDTAEYYLQNIKNYINEIFNNIPHYLIVKDHNNICIFLLHHRNSDIHNLENAIIYCSELIDTIKSILDFELKIGISLYHTKPDDIFIAYEESKEALKNTFYFASEPIYIFCSTSEQCEISSSINTINDNILTILSLFKANKYTEITSILDSTFALLKNEFVDIQTARSYSLLLYSYFFEFKDTKSLSTTSLKTINLTFTKLTQAKNIDELRELLFEVFNHTTNLKSLNYDNYLVNMANDYISKNYNQNISLSSISKALSVNSSYLSRLYKKITTQNLTTSITKHRIDKAIELLTTTDMKIYKIANLVGIEDATYFSLLFKKYTHHNPSHYR